MKNYTKCLKVQLIKNYIDISEKIVEQIFLKNNLIPIKCTTFNKINNKTIPYNFILKDNSTLSVRTSTTYKVAPREIGQAGYDKLNQYFAKIYKSIIKNKDDIKKLVLNNIYYIFPIF